MQNAQSIHEKARDIPVRGSYDVVVCGGGIAGIAAALAAARQGVRVALVEREYLLGGLATLGLITVYLPLCDGRGHQCSFGIAEELLRLSVLHGAEAPLPRGWMTDTDDEAAKSKNRFSVRFNPSVFAILAEQVLRQAGVEMLYGLAVVGGRRAGKKLTHILCEGRDGRFALACGSGRGCHGGCRALPPAGHDLRHLCLQKHPALLVLLSAGQHLPPANAGLCRKPQHRPLRE